MGTLKACLAVVSDFTVEDFDALEAKARDYAGGKPLTNQHFIKAAKDVIATLQDDVKTIEAGMEPEAAPVQGANAPPEPAQKAAETEQVDNKDLTQNAPETPEDRKQRGERVVQRMYAALDRGDLRFEDLAEINTLLQEGQVEDAEAALRAAQAAPASGAEERDASRARSELRPIVQKLPEAQKAKLQTHYQAPMSSAQFWVRLRDDVARYVNAGASAVSGAIRSIVKTVATAALAAAVVLNPMAFNNSYAFNLPATFKSEVKAGNQAELPASAAAKMSESAKAVYRTMAPVAAKSGKGFMIADKPNGMLHAFRPDGTPVAQESALYGKDMGDVLGKSSFAGGPKITPSGRYTLAVSRDADYAGGMTFDLKETSDGSSVVAVHAVYLGDATEKRAERLASRDPADKRVSYGCINTTNETFLNKLLPNAEVFNGGMILVLPDSQVRMGQFTNAQEAAPTEAAAGPAGGMLATEQRREQIGITRQDRGGKRTAARRAPGEADTDIDVRYRTPEGQDPPSNPISREALEKIVNTVARFLAGRVKVTILDDVAEFDPTQKPGSRAGVLTGKGDIILFRSGIADGVAGMKTVFHELLHRGLRVLYSPQEYQQVMTWLYDNAPEVRAAADKWLAKAKIKDLRGLSETERTVLAVDEALADFAETTKPTLLRQLGNWLARIASQMGLNDLARSIRTMQMTQLEKFVSDALRAATNPDKDIQSDTGETRYRTASEAVQGMADNLRYDKLGMARRGVLSSSFLRDIGSRFGEKIKGVKQYVEATFDMSATAADIQEEATKVQDAITALPAAQRAELVEFMADVTSGNVVVEETTDRNNDHLTDRADADALQAKFARMSDKQKAAYRLARESLAKLWKKRGELLTRTADDIYNPLISEARRAGNEQQTATLERERRAYIEDINARLNELKGDYFPLMRFGEYAVVRKSAAYEALQQQADTAYDELNALLDKYEAKTPDERKAIKEANKRLKTLGADLIGEFTPEQDAEIKAARKKYNDAQAKLEGMKSSETDYYMAQFESEAEARSHAKEIGGKVLLKQQMHRELNPINRSMLNRLGESLETTMRARGGVTALRDAKQAMYQVFLSSLPERSALKRQAKRKNVAGFNRDMERAIVSSMLRDSFYLSRMEHSDRINEALTTARKDAESKGDIALQEVGEELAKRLASSMRFVDTPVQDAIAGLTYAWQLGVSPGYLIANMVQPFTVSVPMMWARHGAKATRAFASAWGDTAKAVLKSLKGSLRGEIDFENSGLPADEVAMLNAMLRNRLLNVTLVQDLARTADGKTVSRLSSFLAKPSHFVEVANRMSTALAAYRLEKPRGQEAAIRYAQRVLADTHFDYSAENAPYWMKPGVVPLNKIMFQFKKYQAGMISLFVKAGAAMATGDKTARAEAKAQVLGMLGTHFAIGGVIGLPAVGTLLFLSNLVAKAFGDDEPWDAEVALRNYLADQFGPEAGAAVAKGLPVLLGADLSQKVGLGDLLNPIPTLRDDKQGRDFYLELLAASAGPFLGGIVPRMFEAMSNLAQGNFIKAAEGVVPKWVADPIRAGRFAAEGVTTKQGTVALDPEALSAWDVALQAAGVPAARITESYEARAAIENQKAKLTRTASQYKKDWLEAKADGDSARAEELWQEIRTKVNPVRVRNGLEPITKSELLRFQQQRKKTEGKYAQFGGNANEKLAQVGRFALQ